MATLLGTGICYQCSKQCTYQDSGVQIQRQTHNPRHVHNKPSLNHGSSNMRGYLWKPSIMLYEQPLHLRYTTRPRSCTTIAYPISVIAPSSLPNKLLRTSFVELLGPDTSQTTLYAGRTAHQTRRQHGKVAYLGFLQVRQEVPLAS